MPPLTALLALLALLLTIGNAVNPPRVPLWVPVVLLCLIAMLASWRL